MEDNILDVLMYLFENYMDEDSHITTDHDALHVELTQAGFLSTEIYKALKWLDGLVTRPDSQDTQKQNIASIRIYTEEEMAKLDLECRGFLLFLEQINVLDPINRELVLDRVMALETDEFSLEELKWVILMVLFNQPGYEAAFAWIEDLVYEEMAGQIH
ncbi:DUF494 family protein [Beggiatoa leptomitoformis]|uniref:Protein Smg homolog n=1 Tax=Beggiatoa leptomitoformis TaxID=288004 RepID=A0A2N9YJE3_9GAMM|nr:DUF494 family protein [Beggiatoa leptomitoformis]ALG69491.1 DUF494 family protein [Beggiatoa leptomitoformis]AUI70604.1 DUF494 family protein [Beggiatoa leptomitoformis]